jgi:hypothetical protein
MSIFCYKKILIENYQSIAFELSNAINLSRYKDNFTYVDLNPNDIPLFFSWVNANNCSIRKTAIIVSTTESLNADPHIDSQTNSLALNFPLANCSNSYTVFYDPTDIVSMTQYEKSNGVIYKKIRFNNTPKEIERYTLDSAVVINTHIPHKVFHRDSKPRYSLSFRFEEDPWHLI